MRTTVQMMGIVGVISCPVRWSSDCVDTGAALAGSDGGGGGEGPGSTPGHWSWHNMGTRATTALPDLQLRIL